MNWKNFFMGIIIVAFIFVCSQIVLAAPYCAVFSYGKNCWYYNYDDCVRAAGNQGACVVNQDEVKPPSGSARFCVVTSYSTNCWYYSADSCRQAAASSGGVCVVNPN